MGEQLTTATSTSVPSKQYTSSVVPRPTAPSVCQPFSRLPRCSVIDDGRETRSLMFPS